MLEALGHALAVSWLCAGGLWRVLLERLVGLCWSPVAACAMDTGYHSIQEDPPLPAAGDRHARDAQAICLIAREVV